MIDRYLTYLSTVRRYSPRTCEIYRGVLEDFCSYLEASGAAPPNFALRAHPSQPDGWAPPVHEATGGHGSAGQPRRLRNRRLYPRRKLLMLTWQAGPRGSEYPAIPLEEGVGKGSRSDVQIAVEAKLCDVQAIRNYEVYLLDEKGESAKTVSLHLSVLSGFCKFLMKQGLLESNPVRLVARPKQEKRLPVFYREDAMREYFEKTKGVLEYGKYEDQLQRMILGLLYGTGLRRSELISLDRNAVDFSRRVLRVRGKGDKMREIPLTASLCDEILLYLQSVDSLKCADKAPEAPLLQTPRGARLYPVYVDRAVKAALGQVGSISGRKSPHVLRHTLATELLDGGADLNSIKELLGHSSLAATQVYTHNSIERLQNVYKSAHPRAKNDGNHGD